MHSTPADDRGPGSHDQPSESAGEWPVPGDEVMFFLHPNWANIDLLVIGTVGVVGQYTVEVVATAGGRLLRHGGHYWPWLEQVRPCPVHIHDLQEAYEVLTSADPRRRVVSAPEPVLPAIAPATGSDG